jgi:leucyl-tRNA synthetase
VKWLEARGLGRAAVQWRIRDWLVSRQRYWGTPIPVIHCAACGPQPVPDEDLPVVLPKGVDFTPTGKSPLASVPEFVKAECPRCGGAAQRETDTLDTFTDSSWYFFRYLAPRDEARIFRREDAERWFPIDQYIGGIEHARGHLLYCRFLTMFLHDLGLSPVEEPVERLFTQGMICKVAYRCEDHKWIHESEVDLEDRASPRCGTCGKPVRAKVFKMSKTKKNVTNPGEHLAEVGVDASRLYTLFIGPPALDAEWNDDAVFGPFKFLQRFWDSAHRHAEKVRRYRARGPGGDAGLRRKTHQTIEAVTQDVEAFGFNTAIARLMELGNMIRQESLQDDDALGEALWMMTRLLAPFAPHVAEEVHALFGGEGSVFLGGWPQADRAVAAEDDVEIPVQVNGKIKGRTRVPAGASREAILAAARADAAERGYLEGRAVLKEIVVPGRLVNFVVKA